MLKGALFQSFLASLLKQDWVSFDFAVSGMTFEVLALVSLSSSAVILGPILWDSW